MPPTVPVILFAVVAGIYLITYYGSAVLLPTLAPPLREYLRLALGPAFGPPGWASVCSPPWGALRMAADTEECPAAADKGCRGRYLFLGPSPRSTRWFLTSRSVELWGPRVIRGDDCLAVQRMILDILPASLSMWSGDSRSETGSKLRQGSLAGLSKLIGGLPSRRPSVRRGGL